VDRSRGLVWAGFLSLILVLGIGFHLDVRDRDAFSWMDPYQYYEFALAVLDGSEHYSEFEIPSIFPFFLLPALAISPSIPAALWTNFAFTLLLVLAVHRLCRELEIETPSPLVALLALSSPLLLGLSRTMYVEYGLSALVASTFLLWMRLSKAPGGWTAAGFAIAFGVGFMLKMTFPLFFVLPVGVAVLERLIGRRSREALVLVAATAAPLVVVLLIQAIVFAPSFGYYLDLGSTALPIMKLIGPPEWLSWASATYYLGELGRTLTFLLTPFLALAAWAVWRGRSELGWSDWSSPRSTLWLWLLGPLLLLIAQPVKEPRHVAPCVVPAVLLIVIGIEGWPRRAVRVSLLSSALALALLQFALVSGGRMETPYFLDRPIRWEEIWNRMIQAEDLGRYRRTPEAQRLLHWKYAHNVAIEGFPANEALALVWQAFPGVAFDLDTLEDPTRVSAEIPYSQFEDLYIFTAFNAYNRRCGWHRFYDTLSRQAVVENADFVLVNGDGSEEPAGRYPDHVLVARVERGDGAVTILRSRRGETTPYRALYAQEFLARHPALSREEKRVVAKEMYMAAVLGGFDGQARAILRDHPFHRRDLPALRNIYWFAGYGTIEQLAVERLRPRGIQ
jgi:hypothetical protein